MTSKSAMILYNLIGQWRWSAVSRKSARNSFPASILAVNDADPRLVENLRVIPFLLRF